MTPNSRLPAGQVAGNYRLLLENMSQACFALDGQWNFVSMNQHAEELLEYPREQLLGRNYWEYFPEARTLGLMQKYDMALTNGQPVTFGLYYPRHRRWYNLKVVPTEPGLLVLFQSDDRRASEELRYRALVENALDGITLLDSDLNPFYRSPANATILGYSHDETGAFQPTPHQPEELSDLAPRLRSLPANESFGVEFRTVRPDGDARWIHGTFTNRLADPELGAIIFNFRDVTENRRLRDEMQHKQVELLEANRQLRVRIGRLDTLHRVHLAASQVGAFDTGIGRILSSALQDSTAAACVFVESIDEFKCMASGGLERPLKGPPEDALCGIAREAVQVGEFRFSDLGVNASGDSGLLALAAEGFRGLHAVPFQVGETRGALTLLTRDVMFDDAESRSYITTLTGYVAGALDTMRLLESLKRTADDYRELARFGQRIETITDINELVTHGLSELLVQLKVDYATLAALENGHAIPRWRAGEADPETQELLWRPIPLDKGAVAEAVESGGPVLVQDYRNYSDRPEYLERLEFTSVLALPIDTGAGGRFVCILATADPDRQIDDTSVSIAALFAQRMANAFERVAYLDEVKSTREATFRSLGLALEYRDYETKGHTDRVVELAESFGQALGFGRLESQALRWGAYLHDLGKLSVPDQVLLKPGRLNEHEFGLIRKHPVTGAEFCRDIPFLPDSTRALVLHHHEKWDGTGYPDGLSGNAIPLHARIFSLVDVYDALTSDRPYRPAWSHKRAVEHIRSESGRHFDPELVERFLALLD